MINEIQDNCRVSTLCSSSLELSYVCVWGEGRRRGGDFLLFVLHFFNSI